jgi:hypothetical protein
MRDTAVKDSVEKWEYHVRLWEKNTTSTIRHYIDRRAKLFEEAGEEPRTARRKAIKALIDVQRASLKRTLKGMGEEG